MISGIRLFQLLFALLIFHACLPTAAQSPPRLFSENHVVRSLRQIHSAQATYQAAIGGGNFGTLQNLRQAGFIDVALSSGAKYGYVYVLSVVTAVPGQSPAHFSVTATPRAYRKSGIRSFYLDAGGELHGGDKGGTLATASDPVIDDCTNGSIPDNERCTIQDIQSLVSAQAIFASTLGNGNYGLFNQLYLAGLIRGDLADHISRGYFFNLQTIDQVPGTNPASFKIWATPRIYGTTAIRSFYTDQTGVIRGGDKNGGDANENDPPINKSFRK